MVQPAAAASTGRRAGRWSIALRLAFVLVAAGAAVWTLRQDLGTLPAALARIGSLRTVGAIALVLVGLLTTVAGWQSCLAALGSRVEPGVARRVFFPGQLGKYLPGSVWTFLAQARLASQFGIPAATALAAGPVFLAVHVSTGAVLAMALLPWTLGHASAPLLVVLSALAIGLLHPRVLALVVRVLRWRSDQPAPSTLRWRDVLVPIAWMVPTWACFGGATALVFGAVADSTPLASLLTTSVGAFAMAFVVGVGVMVAPAGLGAREAVLVLAFAPAVGAGTATSAAILLRVCHVVADIVLAVWYGSARHDRRKAVEE